MKKQGKVIQEKKLYNQFEKDVAEIAGNFVKEFTGTREKETANDEKHKKPSTTSRYSVFD